MYNKYSNMTDKVNLRGSRKIPFPHKLSILDESQKIETVKILFLTVALSKDDKLAKNCYVPILLVKTLAAFSAVTLLWFQPRSGRRSVSPPGQMEFGCSSPDAVAWTATGPRSSRWWTLNSCGLLVSHCPLQHETQHLRKHTNCSVYLTPLMSMRVTGHYPETLQALVTYFLNSHIRWYPPVSKTEISKEVFNLKFFSEAYLSLILNTCPDTTAL